MIYLDKIIKALKAAQRKQYDAALAISGYVGEGKSTFSLQLMKAYYEIDNLNDFKKMCEKYLVYSRNDLKNITTKEKFRFINADEAINILFKRDFMKGEQKNILRTLDVCRDMGHVFTFIIPSFWALDQHTVQTRIRLWVYVEKQKYAHFSRPLRNPYSIDVWNRTYNEKVIQKSGSITNTLNYVYSIKFDPLSPEEYKIYQKVKHEKRLKSQEEDDKKPLISRSELARLIKGYNADASSRRIAELLKLDDSTVRRAVRGVGSING